MGSLQEVEALQLVEQLTGNKACRANAYVELSGETEDNTLLDVTVFYRIMPDEPKRRIDAVYTLKAHKEVLATEAVDPSLWE